MQEKQAIRDRMKALRLGLSAVEAERAGRAVAQRVLASPAAGGVVSVYASLPGELDTAPILAALWERGATVALPDWEGWKKGEGLRMLAVSCPEDVQREGRRVPQPACRPGRALPPAQAGLFLVPGVAFDRQGRRIGMGGGFYDRLLARASREALFFGLAYDFQVLEQLPAEPHDVPMHRVIHPSGEDGPGPAVR